VTNIDWRAIVGTITHAPAKITPAHVVTAVIVLSAFGAAFFFWLATLDGLPAVGYYRLGLTVAFAGAVLTWVIRLHNRCREQAARLKAVEADLEAIKEDAHVRKALRQWRRRGATADVFTDN